MLNKQTIISLALVLLVGGCGVFTSRVEIPKWYLKVPEKKGYMYTTGTELSDKIENAISEATLVAAEKLGKQMGVEIESLTKRAQEEGMDITQVNEFTTTIKSRMSTDLNDWRVAKQQVEPAGKKNNRKMYQAYVLIEWNQIAAQERVLEQLKANDRIDAKFRATELFKELEDEVAKSKKSY